MTHSAAPDGGPDGGHSAGLRGAHLVGRLLDALVRSSRVQGEAPRVAVERALGAWREAGFGTLVLEPTTLWLNNEVALGGPEGDARWVLLAFMAGLRAITPEAEPTVEELGLLAAELASLEPSVGAIQRFQDWLWGDGAQGFHCDLQGSFMEALDGVTRAAETERPEAVTDAPSLSAVASCAEDRVELTWQALQAVSGRPELEVALPSGLAPSKVEPCLSDALRGALRAGCEDPDAWTIAEASAALAHPVLGATRTVRQRAEALRSAFSRAVDLPVLEGLAGHARHNDPVARRIIALLEDDALAARAAQALAAARAEPSRVGGLLVGSGAAFARALMLELLALGALEVDGLAHLAGSLGPQRLLDLLDLGRLDREGAALTLRVLERVDAEDDVWVRAFQGLSPESAAALLPTVPARCLREGAAELARVAVGLDPRALGTALGTLMELQGPHAVRFVSHCLRQSHGRGWPRSVLVATARLLADAGVGRAVLVPMVHSRDVDARVRVLLLQALENDREALHEALQRRVGELLDPQEVRDALRTLRSAAGVPS